MRLACKKLDYCNSLYYKLPKSKLSRLQQIQKSKKVKVLVGFFYSAVQSQEVAVDWQEPMVRKRNAAAATHTTVPINHTRPLHRKHSPGGAARARKQTSN